MVVAVFRKCRNGVADGILEGVSLNAHKQLGLKVSAQGTCIRYYLQTVELDRAGRLAVATHGELEGGYHGLEAQLHIGNIASTLHTHDGIGIHVGKAHVGISRVGGAGRTLAVQQLRLQDRSPVRHPGKLFAAVPLYGDSTLLEDRRRYVKVRFGRIHRKKAEVAGNAALGELKPLAVAVFVLRPGIRLDGVDAGVVYRIVVRVHIHPSNLVPAARMGVITRSAHLEPVGIGAHVVYPRIGTDDGDAVAALPVDALARGTTLIRGLARIGRPGKRKGSRADSELDRNTPASLRQILNTRNRCHGNGGHHCRQSYHIYYIPFHLRKAPYQ